MRVYRDDLTRTARRVWYTVPIRPSAAWTHHFQAAKYDTYTRPGVLGELAQTKRPYGGQAPYLVVTPGLGCGTPDEFINGILTTKPPAVIDPNTGAPLCCGPCLVLCAGGEAEGGDCDELGGFLLQEDLFLLLQEDGSRIILT